MNNTSLLFKTLTENEIKIITDKIYGSEKILNYGLLEGGLFNTTYRVITENHDFILRLGPVHRELLLPYEHNLMKAEAEVNRLCALNEIPASKVIFLDTSKKFLDRDIMAVERIESKPLSDKSIPETALPDIHLQCGKLLRKMHGIVGNKFGRLSNIASGKAYDNWYEALKGEITDIFKVADVYKVYDNEIKERSYLYLEKHKDLLLKITEPRLIHCDLWSGNVLVNEENGKYTVKAIIDGDRAMYGDSDYDIATEWMITEDFMKGYGDTSSVFSPEEIKEKRSVYYLIQALMDAYIWLIEYKNREAFENNLSKVKNILNKL